MKLRYLILFLLLGALLCGTVLAAEAQDRTYLWDEADVLTSEEEARVNQQLADMSQKISMEIICVTVNEYGATENSADMYFYQKSRTGNGVILLLAFSDRGNNYYIAARGEAWESFTEKAYDKVENACVSKLRNGNYADAIIAYGKTSRKVIATYGKVGIGGIILCILIGAGLSFLIPMNIMKGQLKTVRSQPGAASYIRKNSMKLTTQRDTFLYQNVRRVARPKNTNSGGGGSRSGGGGGGRGGSF